VKTLFKWLILWAGLAGAILCFLLLQVNNPFYADDYFHLASAKFILDPAETLWRYGFGRVFWRPVTNFSDLLAFRVLGLNPLGWHIFDLVLHSLNALLVALIFFQLSGKRPKDKPGLLIFLAGLIFAVHPIGLLTAAWMACRQDLLATFFSLLSIAAVLSAFRSGRWRLVKIFSAAVLAFLGFLSKESALILPATAFFVVLLFPREASGKRKFFAASSVFLALCAVLVIYFLLRMKLFGGFTGYEKMEPAASFFLPRLIYHIPRVLFYSLKDYLFWHAASGQVWHSILFWSFLALAGLSLIYILKKPSLAALGIIWILISLAPVWNLSQMFAYGEARMLYLGMAGFAIAAGAAVSAITSRILRAAAWAAVLLILISFGAAGWRELYSFQARSRQYEKVRELIEKSAPASGKTEFARRIYVYGLDFDLYYLDCMLKVYNPDWLNRIVALADSPTLGWIAYDTVKNYDLANSALPGLELHYTDKKTAMVTVIPPDDLIQAAVDDPQALFLELKNGSLSEISADLIQLSRSRRYLQASRAEGRGLRMFPTFGFRKRNYPIDWELSAGLDAITPEFIGQPYRFVSKNRDPYLVSPPLSFPAIATAGVEIEMRIIPKKYLAPQEKDACLLWMTNKDAVFKPQQKNCFPVDADGQFHTYRIMLDRNLYWLRSGVISKVRLDPISFPGWFELGTINFEPIMYPK